MPVSTTSWHFRPELSQLHANRYVDHATMPAGAAKKVSLSMDAPRDSFNGVATDHIQSIDPE